MKSNSDGVVYLDNFRITDASSLLAADNDSEHRKRFDFPLDFVPSIEHSRNVIRDWICAGKLGRRYAHAVRVTDSDCLVGGAADETIRVCDPHCMCVSPPQLTGTYPIPDYIPRVLNRGHKIERKIKSFSMLGIIVCSKQA